MKMILDDLKRVWNDVGDVVMIGMMRGEVRKVGRVKNLEKKPEMRGILCKIHQC